MLETSFTCVVPTLIVGFLMLQGGTARPANDVWLYISRGFIFISNEMYDSLNVVE